MLMKLTPSRGLRFSIFYISSSLFSEVLVTNVEKGIIIVEIKHEINLFRM